MDRRLYNKIRCFCSNILVSNKKERHLDDLVQTVALKHFETKGRCNWKWVACDYLRANGLSKRATIESKGFNNCQQVGEHDFILDSAVDSINENSLRKDFERVVPLAQLTKKEEEISRLIIEGYRQKEIAFIMNVSPCTISSMRKRMESKVRDCVNGQRQEKISDNILSYLNIKKGTRLWALRYLDRGRTRLAL